jgi:hypothetical protein
MSAKLQSFVSIESAKRFIADVDIGAPPPNLGKYVGIDSFAISSLPKLHFAAFEADTDVGTDAVPAPAAAAAPSPVAPAPDPFSLQGALALKTEVQQSFAVGSGLLSFDVGVTVDRRKAAINSTLLAQLAANKAYPEVDAANYTSNWYSFYFNTLTNLGWVLQGDSTVHTYTSTSTGTVEQELLTLASSLVGATGAAAVKAIFDSLAKLGDGNPIITVFKESAEKLNLAQFTVSLASNDANDGFLIDGIQFDLEAEGIDDQVLFIEWKSQSATITWRNIKLSLADDVYASVADAVAKKVAAFVGAKVSSIDV